MTATIADRYEHLQAMATYRMEWGDRTVTTDEGLTVINGVRIWDLATGDEVDFVDITEWADNTEISDALKGAGYIALGLKFLRKVAATPNR
ncbi:hypothetical protein [Gordonia aichiensis]|uniref:hypothetical protein n=1 Tax=Gordonia aichiensis TaxID=36820 RepID=UPI00326633FE